MPEVDAQFAHMHGQPEDSELGVCASSMLLERGDAQVFEVLYWGEPVRAFVMRFDERAVGYLNRCAHVPAEMDWQPGRFLDTRQRWIVCSLHGATYEPADGYCVAGPCAGRRLIRLDIFERDGHVFWRPGSGIHPVDVGRPSNPIATDLAG